MTPVLIFGANELAEKLLYRLEHRFNPENWKKMLGFIVDDDFYDAETFCDYPVYRYSDAMEKYISTAEIFLCVGYKKMNENRKSVFQRLQRDGWEIANYVDPSAMINTKHIGSGNIIFEDVRIDVKSHIGDSNIFNQGTLIGHHSTIGNFNWFVHAGIAGHVKIGDCCFLGMNSGVANDVSIADKTLVGGGCFIGNSIIHKNTAYLAPKPMKVENSELVMRYSESHKRCGK